MAGERLHSPRLTPGMTSTADGDSPVSVWLFPLFRWETVKLTVEFVLPMIVGKPTLWRLQGKVIRLLPSKLNVFHAEV